MAKVAGGGWSSVGALVIWSAMAVIELFALIAVAHSADLAALILGRSATVGVAVLLAVLAVVAAVLAWRGVTGPTGVVLASGQFAGAVLVLVIVFGFMGGDGTTASSLAPLLFSCVAAEVMIGVGVLHSARRSADSTKGW